MCYIFLLILILIVWSCANNNGSWFSDLLYCCSNRLIIMLMMINRQIDYCYYGCILFDWLEIIIKSDQIWSKVCMCVLAILFVEFNRDKWVPGTRFFSSNKWCVCPRIKKNFFFTYRLKFIFFSEKKLQFIKFHPFFCFQIYYHYSQTIVVDIFYTVIGVQLPWPMVFFVSITHTHTHTNNNNQLHYQFFLSSEKLSYKKQESCI